MRPRSHQELMRAMAAEFPKPAGAFPAGSLPAGGAPIPAAPTAPPAAALDVVNSPAPLPTAEAAAALRAPTPPTAFASTLGSSKSYDLQRRLRAISLFVETGSFSCSGAAVLIPPAAVTSTSAAELLRRLKLASCVSLPAPALASAPVSLPAPAPWFPAVVGPASAPAVSVSSVAVPAPTLPVGVLGCVSSDVTALVDGRTFGFAEGGSPVSGTPAGNSSPPPSTPPRPPAPCTIGGLLMSPFPFESPLPPGLCTPSSLRQYGLGVGSTPFLGVRTPFLGLQTPGLFNLGLGLTPPGCYFGGDQGADSQADAAAAAAAPGVSVVGYDAGVCREDDDFGYDGYDGYDEGGHTPVATTVAAPGSVARRGHSAQPQPRQWLQTEVDFGAVAVVGAALAGALPQSSPSPVPQPAVQRAPDANPLPPLRLEPWSAPAAGYVVNAVDSMPLCTVRGLVPEATLTWNAGGIAWDSFPTLLYGRLVAAWADRRNRDRVRKQKNKAEPTAPALAPETATFLTGLTEPSSAVTEVCVRELLRGSPGWANDPSALRSVVRAAHVVCAPACICSLQDGQECGGDCGGCHRGGGETALRGDGAVVTQDAPMLALVWVQAFGAALVALSDTSPVPRVLHSARVPGVVCEELRTNPDAFVAPGETREWVLVRAAPVQVRLAALFASLVNASSRGVRTNTRHRYSGPGYFGENARRMFIKTGALPIILKQGLHPGSTEMDAIVDRLASSVEGALDAGAALHAPVPMAAVDLVRYCADVSIGALRGMHATAVDGTATTLVDTAPMLARRGWYFNLRNKFPDNPIQLSAEFDASQLLCDWVHEGSARLVHGPKPAAPPRVKPASQRLHAAAAFGRSTTDDDGNACRARGQQHGARSQSFRPKKRARGRTGARYDDDEADEDYVCSDDDLLQFGEDGAGVDVEWRTTTDILQPISAFGVGTPGGVSYTPYALAFPDADPVPDWVHFPNAGVGAGVGTAGAFFHGNAAAGGFGGFGGFGEDLVVLPDLHAEGADAAADDRMQAHAEAVFTAEGLGGALRPLASIIDDMAAAYVASAAV
jgi:hypothetical protein